jgi:hypothetical protein
MILPDNQYTAPPVPGAAIAVHTFGDFVQFNPHLHLIVTDGCFSDNGTFVKGPVPEPKDLQELFRNEVLKMLKAGGKSMMLSLKICCLGTTIETELTCDYKCSQLPPIDYWTQ